MKRIILALCLISNLAYADLTSVCGVIKNVKAHDLLYKSVPSTGIQSDDKRTTGPTLICGRVCPLKFPAAVFYSDGALATRLGYYGLFAQTNTPRAYCYAGGVPQCFNSILNISSNINGRDGFLYLRIKRGLCYKVNPIGRTGSL
jgi:hypothetical protein